MLTQQRKHHLMAVLERDGRLVAKDIAQALKVSEDTIRRDLRDLAKEGRLQRVHGGALPASKAVQSLASRQSISTAEKAAIGQVAAGLVQPGQVIFLDGGTTAVQVARHLDPSLRVTIITHSPAIAMALAGHQADIRLIGGLVFKHSMVSVGAEAIRAIQKVRADNFFMGVTGIHPEAGLSTGDAEEALIKREIAEASADVTVLASPEKLGAVSPFVIGPCDLMTRLVVTLAAGSQLLDPFRHMGAEIMTATTSP